MVKRKTAEEFITEAIAIHGSKYDYSLVKYFNTKRKVQIICPIHGIFEQAPGDHLHGAKCHKCAKEELSKKYAMGYDEFVKRANVIHGNKYDYSKVYYVNGRTSVTIICPIHGDFQQKPEVHILQKCGCKQCANESNAKSKRFTIKEFIKRANTVHLNKYNYSLVEYSNIDTEVSIICPKHGIFLQKPYVHLKMKCGCPKCAIEQNGKRSRLSLEDFVTRSNKIHKGIYDYSAVKYERNNKKVAIKCPKHGVFYQVPSSHLQGAICPKCVGRNKTTEEFINEAKVVHGNRYDYNKVVYKGAICKVKIVCSKHGIFEQAAIGHISGKGCPKCCASHMEQILMRALEKREIKYETQKNFRWLYYQRKQYLDFYLPDYDAAIECQGIQHFVPTEKTGGEFMYQIQCERDRNKYELCKKYNIKVFYYSSKEDYLPNTYIDIIYNSITNLIEAIKRMKKLKQ